MKHLKFTLVFLLAFSFLSFKVYAQSWLTIGNSVSSGNFLGSTSTTVPLELKTTQAQPINFYTNNTQQMTLSTTGTLNLVTGTAGYQIGGTPVLTFGSTGNPNNLFVGTANVTVSKTLFAANVVLHTANQPDIDLEEKIKELENRIAELEKLLTAKN
ncbi:MAG: hypothetical protein RL065_945 [Bacteroidota bacterium]|jgi:hypothetical protein